MDTTTKRFDFIAVTEASGSHFCKNEDDRGFRFTQFIWKFQTPYF